MRLSVRQDGDFGAMVERDLGKMARAHTSAMRQVSRELKTTWRDEIRAAGLGSRLPNTVRSAAYPQGDVSLNPAAMIWTKAPEIISAHDRGAVIQSPNGLYLAIPLQAAGRGRFGRSMTPLDYERRTGNKLVFVYRRGKPPLLVAQDARVSKAGRAVRKGGRRRKDGILTGAQTVPVFVLKKRVKLPKRTDLLPAAEAVTASLPALASIWTED
jgi:hypothetical protein